MQLLVFALYGKILKLSCHHLVSPNIICVNFDLQKVRRKMTVGRGKTSRLSSMTEIYCDHTVKVLLLECPTCCLYINISGPCSRWISLSGSISLQKQYGYLFILCIFVIIWNACCESFSRSQTAELIVHFMSGTTCFIDEVIQRIHKTVRELIYKRWINLFACRVV